jgi:16S rRNA C1402 N4-methylase RsmH
MDNLDLARPRLDAIDSRVTKHLVHSSFADIDVILEDLGIDSIDFILYDL